MVGMVSQHAGLCMLPQREPFRLVRRAPDDASPPGGEGDTMTQRSPYSKAEQRALKQAALWGWAQRPAPAPPRTFAPQSGRTPALSYTPPVRP